MTLNPSTMRLGIASILVGLVGAYGVRVMMEEDEAPAEVKEVKQSDVPVATADLPAGRVIRRGDIGFVKMTLDDMINRGWQPTHVMMDADQIIGRELRRPVRLGDAFQTTEVHLDGGVPYTVMPGMRAVSIRISDERGGRQARRGDTVDLYFTSEEQEATDQRPAIPQKTIPIAEGVDILDVDYQRPVAESSGNFRRIGPAPTPKPPIFILQVDPDVAGKITALKDYGDFAVMVRSGDEKLGRSRGGEEYTIQGLLGIAEPEAPEQQATYPVEVWYGKQRTVREFPIGPPPGSRPQPAQIPTVDQLAQQPASRAAEVMPDRPAAVAPQTPPPPAAAPQQPQPEPQFPYRPDASPTVQPSTVQPPTPAPPKFDAPAPSPAAGNPFTDDKDPLIGSGDVLP